MSFSLGPIKPGPFKPGQLVRYIAPRYRATPFIKATMMPTELERWSIGIFIDEDIMNTEGLLESHFGLYLFSDKLIRMTHDNFEEYPLCRRTYPWQYL